MFTPSARRFIRTALVALLLILMIVAGFAGPADLDPSFGNAGQVFAAGAPGQSVVLQPDGKIVVGGAANGDFAIYRFNADGTPDTAFAKGGMVTIPIGLSLDFGGHRALAIRPDGKILMAGSTLAGSTSDFAIVRVGTDGQLDPAFHDDGKVTADFEGRDDNVVGAALQSDGKIVVAGYSRSGGLDQIAVARFNPDGALDPTFNGNGKSLTPFGGSASPAALAIDGNGRIIVAGTVADSSGSRFFLMRLTSVGTLDTTLKGSGIVLTQIGDWEASASAMSIAADGKIVVTGSAFNFGVPASADFLAVRYLTDGELDRTFNGFGMVKTPVGPGYDHPMACALQPDGKLVLVGISDRVIGSNNDRDMSIVRYLPNGSLDESFGQIGKRLLSLGSANEGGNDVTVQPNGRIVVAGYSGNRVALLRVRGVGTPVAISRSVSVREDTATPIALSGDPFAYVPVSPPAHGTLSGTASNLIYTPAPNYHGADSFTFKVSDGTDESEVATISITVTPVNDAPFFLRGPNLTVLEDSGQGNFSNWVAHASPGPPDESQQALIFQIVSNDRPDLFATALSLALDGTLSFRPRENSHGTATITARARDTGGTLDGGINLSALQTFSITVASVNDAPRFSRGPDLLVAQDAGAQIFGSWATGISAGPPDEAEQALFFFCEADRPELFVNPPRISPNGTLTFVPDRSASGTTTVRVRLRDSGGTLSGGVDTSSEQTFQIAVTTFDEELGAYSGLVQPDPATSASNDQFGTIRIDAKRSGIFTGTLRLARAAIPLRARFDKAGVARFGPNGATELPLDTYGLLGMVLSLQLDVAGGTDQLKGTLRKRGAPFAVIEADRALHTGDPQPRPPYQNVPPVLLGRYTISMAVNEPQRFPDTFPQGRGVGILTMTRDGVARLTGLLADGTPISAAAPISKDRRWPLYVPVDRGAGSISGFVRFEDVPETSDLNGSLRWFKPANAHTARYPDGWPDGLRTNLAGSKFLLSSAPVLTNLNAIGSDGNAELRFSGAGLLPDPLIQVVNLGPGTRVTVKPPRQAAIQFTLQKSGFFRGSLRINAQETSVFTGVVLQKPRIGAGYFLTRFSSGSVTLAPRPLPDAPSSN